MQQGWSGPPHGWQVPADPIPRPVQAAAPWQVPFMPVPQQDWLGPPQTAHRLPVGPIVHEPAPIWQGATPCPVQQGAPAVPQPRQRPGIPGVSTAQPRPG